jgi:hypothetical protein
MWRSSRAVPVSGIRHSWLSVTSAVGNEPEPGCWSKSNFYREGRHIEPVRFRLHTLMIWVGVVAVNLAVLNALAASRRPNIIGGGLMTWLTLQVGAGQALRRRHGDRAFWLGFVGGGAVVTLSLLYSWSSRQSFLWTVWGRYFALADKVLNFYLDDVVPALSTAIKSRAISMISFRLLSSFVMFLPGGLAALVAGLTTRRIYVGLCRVTHPVDSAPHLSDRPYFE